MSPKKKIETNNAPKAIGPYSQCIVVGDRVYLSAQLGLNPQTMEFVSEDVLEQATQALKNIQALLEAANSNLDKVIKVEIFLTDLSYFPAINTVFAEYFSTDTPPVRQTIGVRELPNYAKVMISCEGMINV